MCVCVFEGARINGSISQPGPASHSGPLSLFTGGENTVCVFHFVSLSLVCLCASMYVCLCVFAYQQLIITLCNDTLHISKDGNDASYLYRRMNA